MAENGTTSLLIQMVALFLPAWAIMVQMFGRLMENSDLDDNPSLIPFFGVGLALSLFSVWMFSRAIAGSIVSYMLEQASATEPNTVILQSMLDVMQGEIAFTSLGAIILIIAAINYFEQYNGAHVVAIILLSFLIMHLGNKYGEIGVVVGGISILIFWDVILSITVWPGIRDSLRERDSIISVDN